MATVKKRTVSAASRAAIADPYDGLASEGDQIELSITAEVKTRQGRSFWVKGGMSSTVRVDETTKEAKSRVAEFVTMYVDEQISDFLD